MQPFEGYVGSDRSVNKVKRNFARDRFISARKSNKPGNISRVGRGGGKDGVFVTGMVEREVCQHFAVE